MIARAHLTIRWRLTLLYAAALFTAGAILIALMYFYLRQSLENNTGGNALSLAQQFLNERGPRVNHPVMTGLVNAISEQAERQRQDTLREMLVWSLFSFAVVGIAAGGFGWLLAGRALRPLQRVTATARRVSEGSLHERIALEGPNDEIKELADTFDAMLERLDRVFDGQRRFVANASHELRTPLAISRTLVEVALDDPDVTASTRQLGATLLAVNRRNERLIDGLLLLARSEQPLDTYLRIDLADLARRVISVVDDTAVRAAVTIRSDLETAHAAGDPALLEHLIHNIVDNALRYNVAAGGWVSIGVAAGPQTAQLVVENSGPVLATQEIEGLFEPFRRRSSTDRIGDGSAVTNSRGAGLGLSIVRSVAAAHGGAVHAAARPDGGLVVTVTLPTVSSYDRC